jgi:adenylosuccinate lyase
MEEYKASVENLFSLTAISPLDGRYRGQLTDLASTLSESSLICGRLMIEVKWLKTLIQEVERKPLPKKILNILDGILKNLDIATTIRIKQIEQKINHDTKAVEYYLKEKLEKYPDFEPYLELIHFGITSDDINNLAYAIIIEEARELYLIPQYEKILDSLEKIAKKNADVPMLARTHGQPATPTTLGKEFINFTTRFMRQANALSETPLYGKFNGATGNFNALCVAFPDIDWPQIAQKFVENLGLGYNPYTTQIEPHDYIAEFSHIVIRANNILISLCRDIWGYISLGYFKQKMHASEVGSSTMPHKINPIDFENAEGNLGVANALFDHFANKLPISRWQRDLSDSTVMRNLGVAIAHSFLAYNSILKGLDKLEVDRKVLADDLNNHWEVLAEAIQTMMRRYKIKNSYEQLKTLTRGKKIDKELLHKFIHELKIPKDAKNRLLKLTPDNYLGKAAELAKSE